jgi:putative membrane protein
MNVELKKFIMTKNLITIFLSSTLFLFISCDQGSKEKDSATSASDTTASKNEGAENTKGKALEEGQKEALKKLATINYMAVQISDHAKNNSQNSDLTDYATKMNEGHTNARTKLSKILKANGIEVPESMPESHQKVADELMSLEGEAYDKKFVNVVVEGHKKAISQVEKLEKSSNEKLQKFAGEMLPKLKELLENAYKFKKSMDA